jgi:hypothetical protein
MRAVFCCLIALTPLLLSAQVDTVRVGPTTPELNGLRYRDHSLATTVTRTHGDTTLSEAHYAIDVRHLTVAGRPVVHVTVGPLPDQPDPRVHITTLLDPRTTLPLHYEIHTTSGGMIDVDFQGTHVTGTRRLAADSALEKIDLTLPEPAFLGAYEDAALDAMPLRIGMLLRVPVLSLPISGGATVQPYFYRVLRRDTVPVNGHALPAWVVESRDTVNTNTIWLIDEPPYTYRWLRVSFRGRVTNLVQVVRLATDQPDTTHAPHIVVPTIDARPEDVATIDGIIRASYETISGPAGQARQWGRDRTLYSGSAYFVETGVTRSGAGYSHGMTYQEYADQDGPELERSGYYEREIGRSVVVFGHVASVMSAWEARSQERGPVVARGVNSIQLINDGRRWWITSINWDSERPDNQIPATLLTKSSSP